mgnify:CR=1 FL=1
MDIVDFYKQQVEKWNADSKCGLCFEFSAPMYESALNVVELEDPCCVQVMLVDIGSTTINTYNSRTSLLESSVCEYAFSMFVLKASDLGTNNYNEIKGHDVDASKWATIYKPLQDCFSCGDNMDFCEILGYSPEVKKWGLKMVRNYQDLNFDGWRIDAILKVNNH